MTQGDILGLLAGGDRRSIGRSNQVAEMVSGHPGLFPKLLQGFWSKNSLVRKRAADAAEKVTRKHPELLPPHRKELLGLMVEAEEPELRWHLAAMVSRFKLEARERRLAASLLTGYLNDRSSIVRTFALQGLAELSQIDPGLRPEVLETLKRAARNGTPAMKARSRKLLRRLAPDEA
jgi:hypothetical protein